MRKYICAHCHKVHTSEDKLTEYKCGANDKEIYDFQNSDEFLQRETQLIRQTRQDMGLDGLVGGLQAIIINTELDKHSSATQELLSTTGFHLDQHFDESEFHTNILKVENSPEIIIRCRKDNGNNPFSAFNMAPKARHLPNTRLETFIFTTNNIDEYFSIQKKRGINFMTGDIQVYDNFRFIQTIPSPYIGCSFGFIEWTGETGNYQGNLPDTKILDIKKPETDFLTNIKHLDHTATRVRARDRDAAIIEFMELTNYNFDFAIYVDHLNSITSVTRLSADDFAMVFTSGITSFIDSENQGPTEKYTTNYGTRTHHMAFHTDEIDATYNKLKKDGMEFLVELLGSPDEGLKQTFTQQSPNTLLVNEYIHRFGDFDGFFTRSNVTGLTKATDRQ